MQLAPQEFFTIVRQLADHTDNTTYFVRAVVRNARTDALLDTIDLVDAGSNSQRFLKEYQVPADTSGEGFYITITSSVYTDSGFTNKSANYGDEANIYLVQERKQNQGGGHSVFTDFKQMQEILDVTMADHMGKMPKAKDLDMSPLFKAAVDEIKREILSIRFPEQKGLDLSPVNKNITDLRNELLRAISGIDIPEPEKVDLSPVLLGIKEIKVNLDKADIQKAIEAVGDLEKLLTKRVPEIESVLDSILSSAKEAFLFIQARAGIKPRTKFKGFEKILP